MHERRHQVQIQHSPLKMIQVEGWTITFHNLVSSKFLNLYFYHTVTYIQGHKCGCLWWIRNCAPYYLFLLTGKDFGVLQRNLHFRCSVLWCLALTHHTVAILIFWYFMSILKFLLQEVQATESLGLPWPLPSLYPSEFLLKLKHAK